MDLEEREKRDRPKITWNKNTIKGSLKAYKLCDVIALYTGQKRTRKNNFIGRRNPLFNGNSYG